MRLIVLLSVIFIFFVKSEGNLRCYSCGFSAVDSDQSCLTITNDTNTVSCTYKYCTIYRQEYVDPAGSIASFMRGCTDEPDYLNHEISDSIFRTFYRACTTDLCNIGNGIESIVGGSLSPTPDNSGANLLVPGTREGNTATDVKISLSLLFLGLSFVLTNMFRYFYLRYKTGGNVLRKKEKQRRRNIRSRAHLRISL